MVSSGDDSRRVIAWYNFMAPKQWVIILLMHKDSQVDKCVFVSMETVVQVKGDQITGMRGVMQKVDHC